MCNYTPRPSKEVVDQLRTVHSSARSTHLGRDVESRLRTSNSVDQRLLITGVDANASVGRGTLCGVRLTSITQSLLATLFSRTKDITKFSFEYTPGIGYAVQEATYGVLCLS